MVSVPRQCSKGVSQSRHAPDSSQSIVEIVYLPALGFNCKAKPLQSFAQLPLGRTRISEALVACCYIPWVFRCRRSRAMSALPVIGRDLRATPLPPGSSQVIPYWRGLERYHPKPSQTAPVHARFSRGWAEIGVGFRDQAPIGVGLMTTPRPYPLC